MFYFISNYIQSNVHQKNYGFYYYFMFIFIQPWQGTSILYNLLCLHPKVMTIWKFCDGSENYNSLSLKCDLENQMVCLSNFD
jgi:hypothetical protein